MPIPTQFTLEIMKHAKLDREWKRNNNLAMTINVNFQFYNFNDVNRTVN